MGYVFARFFSVHFLAGALILALAGREACAQQQAPKPIEIKDRGGAAVALYAESHALIIGISSYTGGWPNLPGVKRDVREVEAALRRHGFSTTVVMDPDRDGLDKAFRGFVNRHGQKADNRLLFYFAGHGHTLTLAYGGEMGYLVPKEAPDPNRDQAGFLDAAMSMQQIEVHARNIQAKHALFVFDSCFSGGIFDAARAIPEVIAEKTGKAVRQFITSGTAEQRVPDESVFRAQFVAALGGEGDTNGDGYVTGAELGQFLEDKVTNYSRRAQTPRYGKLRDPLLDKGDFVFVLPKVAAVAAAPAAPAVPPALPSAEIVFWQSMERSQSAADFEEYLRQFPSGTFAGLARNRLRSLKEQQAAAPPKPAAPTAAPSQQTAAVMAPPKPETKPPVHPAVGVYPKRLAPGTVFRDRRADGAECPECPEMVVVPAGSFTMGSPENEPQRKDDEGPLHRVEIKKSFAVGKFEVTFDEWDACVNTGGCNGYRPRDNAWSRGRRPAINVSWDDAKAYVDWLSRQTGKQYRLLSESEWEYAARGGTTTAWWCGSGDGCLPSVAWYGGDSGGGRTQPVGGKSPNAFGLHDVHGNVWEWVEDCWHAGYQGAPADGGAWTSGGDCSFRVLRGGSWNNNDPRGLRSADRARDVTGGRNGILGFRLARTLD